MSLKTFSKFYYGHEITKDNYTIPFDEGSGELTAELDIGAYTLTGFVAEVSKALNAAGALTYAVSVDRDTRIITIAASGTFELLTSTGLTNASAAWSLLGYTTAADKTGASSYAAENASGEVYENQFIMQDYIDPNHWVSTVDASVNKSTSGVVEVVTFGEEKFLQCNMRYITDLAGDGQVIKTQANAVQNTVNLLSYLIRKNPVEFIPNIDDTDVFYSLLLESTPDNQKGVGFKLRELYDRGLPGYYETGPLKFRVYDV